MLIESLEINAFGKFVEPVRLGPFLPGLNILAQPNEWGKSTVVHALCRALFDKYTSASEEMRSYRPAGTSLSPEVQVEFAAAGERYRLAKRFLDARKCELYEHSGGGWCKLHEADRADQRVRELMGAPALGNRRASAETWGLIRYLWCRQDDAAEWPCWEGDCGEQTRSRLATVEIDPLVGRLIERLRMIGGEHLTTQGKVKKNSPLQKVEEEIVSARASLDVLQAKRRETDGLEDQLRALRSENPRLEREFQQRTLEADALQKAAETAERVRQDIALAAAEAQGAELALQTLDEENRSLESLAAALATERRVQEEARAGEQEIHAAIRTLKEKHESTGGLLRQAEAERTSRQKLLEKTRELLAIKERASLIATLSRDLELVEKCVREIGEIETRLARLPKIGEADLKKGRQLERALAETHAKLTAAGLTVRLEPLADSIVATQVDDSLEIPLTIADGSPCEIHAVQKISLDLPGWGKVSLHSGARETAQLQVQAREIESQLARWAQDLGVADLREGEAIVPEAGQWRESLRVARATQGAYLGRWSSHSEMERALAVARKAQEQARERFVFSPEEEVGTATSLQMAVESMTEAERLATEQIERCRAEGARLQESLEQARKQMGREEQKLAASTGRGRALEEQRTQMVARHPDGLAEALKQARHSWVRAQARLETLQEQQNPEGEKLPERAARASRALGEIGQKLAAQTREMERLVTVLKERGGEGSFAKEQAAQGVLEQAEESARHHRRRAIAARLLARLIERREQSSIRAVLHPLEERLTAAFAALTGVKERRVWFDEHLAVKGVGTSEEKMVSFDLLSRGAREQLLLALRAAIALEVSTKEDPQCLVLDDVLVHTDQARHENVLDFLQQLSEKVQVLLLTCHAERYRGIGHAIPVERSAAGTSGSAART